MASDLYKRARETSLVRKLTQSALTAKMTRYAIGSVVALATSILVFGLMYVVGFPTTACSVGAFIAGAIPNWILNRRWAWKLKGEVAFLREIVAYVAISIVVLIASSAATGATNGWVTRHFASGTGIRVILVTGAYVFVQAVLFVAKFVIYEHWVFAGRSRLRAAVRSRHQVWTAARANRTP